VNKMLEGITSLIVGVFDFVFSPIAAFPPHISLLIIAAFLTLLIVFLNKIFVNRKILKEIKTKMQEIRENLTQAQKEGNTEQINKFLTEFMSINKNYMKQSFKGMIISLVVIAIFLPWLTYKYSGMTIATLPFKLPIIGSNLSWLYWYFLVALTIGWVVNRLIGD